MDRRRMVLAVSLNAFAGLWHGSKASISTYLPSTRGSPLLRLSVGTLRQVVKPPIALVSQQLTSYGGLDSHQRVVERGRQ